MTQPEEFTYTINKQQYIVTAVYSRTGETFADYLLRLLQAEIDPTHMLAPQQ